MDEEATFSLPGINQQDIAVNALLNRVPCKTTQTNKTRLKNQSGTKQPPPRTPCLTPKPASYIPQTSILNTVNALLPLSHNPVRSLPRKKTLQSLICPQKCPHIRRRQIISFDKVSPFPPSQSVTSALKPWQQPHPPDTARNCSMLPAAARP